MAVHRFSFQNAYISHYQLGASTVGNCETKVLILEDDPLAASELKDCLAREGLHPSIACSKEHFEKIVEQHEFQLLIVDIGLPDGSGLDVIREVREQSSVGIIVVSGYTTESDVVAAIELGADDYIIKPFEAIELNFGVNESAVIKLMRCQIKSRSFRLWRQRVASRKTKHLALRSPEVNRGYCPTQYKQR